jgi:hypothetical protein
MGAARNGGGGMTALTDTLAVIRDDAEAIEHAIHDGRLTPHGILLAGTEVVLEIAESRAQGARTPGGLPTLVAADYADNPAAFCARMRTALALAAQLHHAPQLLPMLTATNLILLPAVRVELGWGVLDTDVWRRVTAVPELLGDALDEDGGQVLLVLEGRGPVTYRRGERVWARAPQPDAITVLGCIAPDCAAEGPYTLTDDGLMCPAHTADHALAETAGGDEQ